MKARHGQVAIYLALVVVVLAILMLMNVGVFLSVRSKNRMMNAVDESALAVAKWQGQLLNELGEMNVRHLKALIRPNEVEWSEEDLQRQRDLALFDPLQGIEIGNRTAAAWGMEEGGSKEIEEVLREHVGEILNDYCNNPDLYPESYDGQWKNYAAQLSSYLGSGLTVAPGFIEAASAWSQEPLLSEAFYDAIAARAWCWFGLGGRERYFDMDSKTMPRPEFQEPKVQENSEIYSLHVTFKSWLDSAWADEYTPGAGFSPRWTNFVCRVTGCSAQEVARSRVDDLQEVWCFYDYNWRAWSRTFNPTDYPIAGNVKPEYDVAGCVSSCMMVGAVPRLLSDGESSCRTMIVTAEAKPLGTVVDLDGQVAPVTAWNSFIAPSFPGGKIFTEAQLVLMYSVPRSPGLSLNPQWFEHVKHHLPNYLGQGDCSHGECYYCRQLALWENATFRAEAHRWLTENGDSCHVDGGETRQKGGYGWAH